MKTVNNKNRREIILSYLTIFSSLIVIMIAIFFFAIILNVLHYENYSEAPFREEAWTDGPVNAEPRYSWLPFYTFYSSNAEVFGDKALFIGIKGLSSPWQSSNDSIFMVYAAANNMLIIDALIFRLILVILFIITCLNIMIIILNYFGIRNLLNGKNFFQNHELNSNYIWYLFIETFFTFYIFSYLKIYLVLKKHEYSNKNHSNKIAIGTFINLLWSSLFIALLIFIFFFVLVFSLVPYFLTAIIIGFWMFLIVLLVQTNLNLFINKNDKIFFLLPYYCFFSGNFVSAYLFKKINKESYLLEAKDKVAFTNFKINFFLISFTPILILLSILIFYSQYDGMWIFHQTTDHTFKTIEKRPTDWYIGGEKQYLNLTSNYFYINYPTTPYNFSLIIWNFIILYIYLLYFLYILFFLNVNRRIFLFKNKIDYHFFYIFSLFQLNFSNSYLLKGELNNKKNITVNVAVRSFIAIFILLFILLDIFYINNLIFSSMGIYQENEEFVSILMPNCKRWYRIVFIPLLLGIIITWTSEFFLYYWQKKNKSKV